MASVTDPIVHVKTARRPLSDAAGDFSFRYDRGATPHDQMVMIPGQTSEDFERFAPESRFCEYFDGVIYMPSPVSDRHQLLVGFLFDLLNGYRYERLDLIEAVLMGPAVLRLDPEHKPEPDIFVRGVGERDPDRILLVIEVLSPSNEWYDLEFKSAFYRKAGVPESWFIDPGDGTVVVDLRGETGPLRESIQSGRLDSKALPGFWLDTDWLRGRPLPNPRRCLDAMLTGA